MKISNVDLQLTEVSLSTKMTKTKTDIFKKITVIKLHYSDLNQNEKQHWKYIKLLQNINKCYNCIWIILNNSVFSVTPFVWDRNTIRKRWVFYHLLYIRIFAIVNANKSLILTLQFVFKLIKQNYHQKDFTEDYYGIFQTALASSGFMCSSLRQRGKS